MKATTRRKFLKSIVGVPAAALWIGSAAAHPETAKIRWDIVSVQPPNMMAGGKASARANDSSKLTLTGTGTFVVGKPDAVTGGGFWTITNSKGDVTGRGTYRVTGLVGFREAPGVFPLDFTDLIGNATDARAGLAILKITYSDGSQGILVISCHLVGTPPSIFEGITASMGFVGFWNREVPSDDPFVDANRTLFHVVR